MSRSYENLDRHTTEFTEIQLSHVIEDIIQRVKEDYPKQKINLDRLRNGLYAAHRTKPIRLIALLNTCAGDFPTDVILGVYRHYDPRTDSMKNGWVAQHSEAHIPSFGDRLFGDDEEEEG